MKTTLASISILLSISVNHAQFYERTGRNIGIYITSSPLSSISARGTSTSLNTYSIGGGFCHMLVPGIFPYAGYRYTAPNPFNASTPVVPSFHALHAGLLFDKHLTKVRQRKIGSCCHYHAIGLVLGPEYQYALGYSRSGEIAGQVGISIYHRVSGASKRNRGNTVQYDLFYRHGFTPLLETDGTKSYSQQFGLRIRYTKHQVFNFLE